jgi:hypothetical protein
MLPLRGNATTTFSPFISRRRYSALGIGCDVDAVDGVGAVGELDVAACVDGDGVLDADEGFDGFGGVVE